MGTLHIEDDHDHEHRPAPMAPLLAAMALVVFSLVSVAWVRWFGEPAEPVPLTPVIAERQLAVADLPEGLVELRDADTGDLIVRYDIGEGAFVRTTLRSLAHARQRVSAGNETPFHLEQRASGRLRLIDPVTGRVLELWAFGPDNAGAFLEFLDSSESNSPVTNDAARSGANAVAQNATRSEHHER